MMSDSTENLDKAQKNQKRVGADESDPETTGPADNLREEAAETVDEKEGSVQFIYGCEPGGMQYLLQLCIL